MRDEFFLGKEMQSGAEVTATDVLFGVLNPDAPFNNVADLAHGSQRMRVRLLKLGSAIIMDGKSSGKRESSGCAKWLLIEHGRRPRRAG